METIKVNELAVALSMDSKELAGILKELGFAGKSTKSKLEEHELDIFFQEMTKKNAVGSIMELISEDALTAEAPKKPEKKAEKKVEKEEKKVEKEPVKKEEKPASKKAETKKAEVKKAEVKKPEVKKPEVKKEEPKKPEVKKTEPKKVQEPPFKKKKEKEVFEYNEEEVKKAIEKPIEKKVRYVDTRTSTIEEKTIDDERIKSILKTDDIYGTHDKKQKLKKGGQQHSNKKFEKFDAKAKKQEPPKPEILHIKIPDEITVGDFAYKIKKTAADVIKKLMGLGVMASVNQVIDFDTAALICEEFGVKYEKEIIISLEEQVISDIEDKAEDLLPRSPVVVVMGHVDHGKTSLLDAIRNSDVTSTEAGGITQHIGAYRVNVNGQEITFLDTPGHEAFTAMRARGAQVTDIAILVVAADDGIMPQTIEAINHAKAADVSIIVAINKIDKEGANPDRIKQQLMEHDLVPEEWGGDVICVPVSAKQKLNIDELLENVLLVAEVKELKANPNRVAEGTVIEAKLDKGRGPVATVLVQKGTLHTGDYLIAGSVFGKVRVMINDKGQKIKEAGPSYPVEIVGLNEVPIGGDTFNVVTDERKAKQLVEARKFDKKEEIFNARQKVTLDNLFDHINDGQVKDFNIIVKADVQGSVEAVKQSLVKLSNEEVRLNVIHGGVGGINESDVMLANASNAIIIGFNVRPDQGATTSAEREEVEIRLYRVIYQAIEEMEAAMKGMLAPKYVEKIIGHAEIRETFKISGVGTIAGCYVRDGKIKRNCGVRVVRDNIVIFEGSLNSLKRFKDDAKEVNEGYECGLGIERYNDLKVGDIIECFVEEEVER
ncbi:MAG: translation initiation factor IF-2 [Ruminococcaceae bacterium]|nr:translation initiation factor IF-2 [Oscillospiraceae bacterium]